MNRAAFLPVLLGVTLALAPSGAAGQQDCNRPPKVEGDKWWRKYGAWCTACGGTWDANRARCDRGPNWGQSGNQPSTEAAVAAELEEEEARLRREAEIRRQEQEERERLEEERRRADAEAAKLRAAEFERKKAEALREMKAIGGELGLKEIGSREPLGLKDLPSPGAGGLGLKEIGGKTGLEAGDAAVKQEQDEFDRMNAVWLRRQQESIRDAVSRDKQWKNDVLASIRAIRVPSPVFRPRSLQDVHPGDILLIAPDDSLIAQGIARADPLYRAIDYFSLGNVSAPDFQSGRASHALTVIRAVNGDTLFLDHTHEGSRILSREEYLRRYGRRGMYVARPQAVVDGKELWEAAKKAALQKQSDYGLLGSQVVCSERAAVAVAKATKLPLQEEHHRLGGYLGPVDITPNDFFDREHVGKYFLISASPIVPGAPAR